MLKLSCDQPVARRGGFNWIKTMYYNSPTFALVAVSNYEVEFAQAVSASGLFLVNTTP